MLSKAYNSPTAKEGTWSWQPLFVVFAICLTLYSLILFSATVIICTGIIALSALLMAEKFLVSAMSKRKMTALYRMVSLSLLGMCLGAWAEFGSGGLLVKYGLCTSVSGYGPDSVLRSMAIAPFTHLGMFLGCVMSTLLETSHPFRRPRTIFVILAQSGVFMFIAVMVSRLWNSYDVPQMEYNYLLQILTMQAAMIACALSMTFIRTAAQGEIDFKRS